MTRQEPEFYVNYFPVPPRLRRFLRVVTPILLSAMALVASGVALHMQHPGDGTWSEQEVTLEGFLLAEPWPILRVSDPDAQVRSVILVDYGKLGADRAVEQSGAVGGHARLTGTIIQRDGRQILELAPRPDVIQRLDPPETPQDATHDWAIVPAGQVVIEGEIVDPKCYLGAMRPGTGGVHSACARVCIAGGIPAGLIAPGPDGSERFYLLLTPDALPVGPAILEWVGRPIRVSAALELWGDLPVLRIDPSTIEAL